jgi:hypothetical protein
LSFASNTLIDGYLYPKLCVNDQVAVAPVTEYVFVEPDTTTAFAAYDAVKAFVANDEVPANDDVTEDV